MTEGSPLRVGILGCGFWSAFQVAGWREVDRVEIAGLYNRTRSKADALAAACGGIHVFDTPEALLGAGIDVADIITSEETHRHFVELAAAHGVHVICQKPMAPTPADCRAMVEACRNAGVRLLIHDNWRWQTPIRRFKEELARADIGRPFRAHIRYANSFPVFAKQPFLGELEHFILMDMGTHILDTARALFGEAESILCHTARITPGIRGEDVATVLLRMRDGLHCTVELSYASPVEHDRFPETFLHVEAERGSLDLAPDFWIRRTRDGQTVSFRAPPPVYRWADPAYLVATTAVVPVHREFARCLRQGVRSETEGEEYLHTMELVFAAYRSAAAGRLIRLTGDET
ncbi:MAG: Gfo/Idh/MocA family oxidoreductase [Lentisphaeria bacterium]|nr:Gfo/Idh/MocA family oxidoreductase [Lentisphaeria bacterium]